MHLITYTSQNLILESQLDQEINKIINVAKKRNLQDNITGILIYKNNRFLQAIEGPRENLRSLMSDIESDKRHNDIEYLIDESVSERGFNSWNMEIFKVDDSQKFSLENLQQLTKGFRKNLLTRSDKLMDYYKSLLQ